MSIEYSEMGRRIRSLRKQAHLTQADLAAKCKISTSFMGHIERGSRITSLDTLTRISNEFQVPVDVLIKGTDVAITSIENFTAMMEGEYQMKHSAEIKQEALKSIREIGVLKTKERMGISTGTLYKWQREAKASAEPAPTGEKVLAAKALLAEDDGLLDKIAALEAENARLRASNDKLKKALMAFVE